MNLSDKTRELLQYIIDFYGKNKYGPSFREIVAGLGWSTTALVDHHLKQLEARRLIERKARHPHSIKPTPLALETTHG